MGTMVHDLMEALVSSHGKAEPAALISELKDRFSDDLTPGVDYSGLLTEVAETILSGGYPNQEQGVPVDILQELLSADEVFCELPFCYKEEAASGETDYVIWQGVIDVAYRKNGAWHILDYKTNYENVNLGDQYAPQLSQYARAFEAITGEETDAKIYSIPV